MSWLWRWPSMKERRPWWDRWLLIAAALLVIIGFITLILIAGNDPWTRFQWIGIGAGCPAILILLQFASQRIEERQLKQIIERCRRSPAFRHTSP
jgi:cyanate permease